jgi:DNA helicase II / ATP-dependent DNA helicase PcrA
MPQNSNGGYRPNGKIVAQEGNKLEIEFDHAGLKKVLDSFVSAG